MVEHSSPNGSLTSERAEVLLVCSTGGHLLQLLALRGAWADFSRVWVTFDKTDARSLLAEERVVFAHGPTNRNFGLVAVRNLLRNLVGAARLLRVVRPRVVLTTGAGVAVPYAWIGRALGARVVYVESLTRIEAPSPARDLRHRGDKRGPLRPPARGARGAAERHRARRPARAVVDLPGRRHVSRLPLLRRDGRADGAGSRRRHARRRRLRPDRPPERDPADRRPAPPALRRGRRRPPARVRTPGRERRARHPRRGHGRAPRGDRAPPGLAALSAAPRRAARRGPPRLPGQGGRPPRLGLLLDVAEAAQTLFHDGAVAGRVLLGLADPERRGVLVLGRAPLQKAAVDRLQEDAALELRGNRLPEEVEERRGDVLDPGRELHPGLHGRPGEHHQPLVAVAADVGVLAPRLDLDVIPDRVRAALEIPFPEPGVLGELDEEVGHLVQLGALEEVFSPVDRRDDPLAALAPQVEKPLRDGGADALVLLPRVDGAVRLAPADVHDDVPEGPVGERLRARPVDRRVLLALVGALAQFRQPPLDGGAKPLGDVPAQLEEPVDRPPAQSRAAPDVGQVALAREPGVEVDDPVERACAVVGDDHHVTVWPEPLEQPPDALVQDPVHLGDRARRAVPLPVGPAEMLDVVGRHEDDEEQAGLEALGEPERQVDLLVGGAADDVEVDPAVLADRKAVVELDRAVAARELRHELRRVRHAPPPGGGVEAGDREALDPRSRPGG